MSVRVNADGLDRQARQGAKAPRRGRDFWGPRYERRRERAVLARCAVETAGAAADRSQDAKRVSGRRYEHRRERGLLAMSVRVNADGLDRQARQGAKAPRRGRDFRGPRYAHRGEHEPCSALAFSSERRDGLYNSLFRWRTWRLGLLALIRTGVRSLDDPTSEHGAVSSVPVAWSQRVSFSPWRLGALASLAVNTVGVHANRHGEHGARRALLGSARVHDGVSTAPVTSSRNPLGLSASIRSAARSTQHEPSAPHGVTAASSRSTRSPARMPSASAR